LLSVVEPVLGAGEPGLAVAIPLNPELLEEQRRIAEHRLAGVQERLRAKALRVEARVITKTRPAEAILEAADRERVDLIAMTTHGEGGLRRLLLGSVAYKVVRGSHVPVLVLRPTGY
jgi:nucleotide-binding universal stress UspA family protein